MVRDFRQSKVVSYYSTEALTCSNKDGTTFTYAWDPVSQVVYKAQGGQTNGNSVIQTNRQEAFSFAVNGSPIEDWAGPVAVAFGYEYREEHFSQRADPYSAGLSASTPATANEPCTDPFIDCGLTT